MEGRALRRCRTQLDFSGGQQVRTSKKYVVPTNRMKFPTQEIYRPPGQRQMDGGGQREGSRRGTSGLNPDAEEFVMQGRLQTSKSAGNMLSEGRKRAVREAVSPRRAPDHREQQVKVKEDEGGNINVREGTELRRSKSLYVSSSNSPSNNVTINSNVDSMEGGFSLIQQHHLPPELQNIILKAQGDVSEYSLGELAGLARCLVEKAEEERCYAERLAYTCVTVIEREPHSTFLEALANSLIYSLEKKQADPAKASCYPLLAFLSHLYTLFRTAGKGTDSKSRLGSNPTLQMLHLLAQTCVCMLKNPNLTVCSEIECLFFVVTTIGRELEHEYGKVLEEMMECIRDAAYYSNTTERIRRTLLQILELYAANWQIPAESLSFYQAPTL